MALATALAIAAIATVAMAAEPVTDKAKPKAPWASSTTDDDMAGSLAKVIDERAKDPTSLRFVALGTPDSEVWCAVYSATNSFNARVTEQFYFNNRTNKSSKSAGESRLGLRSRGEETHVSRRECCG